MKFNNPDVLMLTTRKQKKTRTSRGAEMLFCIANLDIMLRGNHLEREECEHCGSSRKSNNPNFIVHENSWENRPSNSSKYGHNSAGTDSSAEFNRLSGELNIRISSEMDEMMNKASAQIQRPLLMQ